MVNQKLSVIAQSALSICEQLERGQAETPLTDNIAKLLSEMQNPVFTVALLGLTPDCLEQTLNWLYGDAFKGFNVDSKQWPGFVELTVSDGDFSFGLLKKQQQTFEQQQAFVQALQIEMGATKASVTNPFTLQAPSSRKLIALKLLIPDNAAALLDSPSLLNAMVSQTNVAMVAAPLRYTLSREDHDAVEALTSNMQGFMPLLTVDELEEDVNLPAVGWWEQHNKAPVTLAPTLITKHIAAALPSSLTKLTDKYRQQFIEHFYANKLSNKLNAVFERYQQEAGVLEQRKSRLKPAGVNTLGIDRRETDKIRQYLDDELITARKDIDANIQQLSLQYSSLSKMVTAAIDDISFENLTSELSHSVIKLAIDENTLSDLRYLIIKESKGAIKQYYQQTQSQLQSVLVDLNQRLQTLAMPKLKQLQIRDCHDIYDALEQRVEVTLNYRGEMPKRTTMTRLGESRKLIMGLSMATVVLGGVAKAGWDMDLRQSLMIFAPIILIGGFLYTYIQWPKEDAERLDKELVKVSDGLKSEARRVVGDVQRFIQQQIFDVLDVQKRRMQKNLQDTIQDFQESTQEKAKLEQQQQQQQQLQIEQELRQWQSIERQLERLKSDAQSLLRSI
ncbi:hypothetical protein [Thalassotalea crassostreae]|uniref:hypothetical protein n=1 Tax=Thalassotalea crassostreae TaxID=1763536 RepID=UPI0008397040|nr:hypothetical protein [Thalassotalea crassostreae]